MQFFFVVLLSLMTSAVLAHTRGFVHNIHYGVFDPASTPLGDVLYIHGYGDTFENHLPLFSAWTGKGLRVVAFDLPSHGKSAGGLRNDLNFYGFEELATLAGEVWRATSTGSNRPLFLAGWSTGGLLVTRMVQSEKMRKALPEISGVITFAPAVAPQTCVGNTFCQITNGTLTHAPELQNRSIKPKSPFSRPVFASKLLANSQLAWHRPVKGDLPFLTFVASDTEDFYVKTPGVKLWIQSMNKKFGSSITGVQCPLARHELDNEPKEYGGDQVREMATDFFLKIIRQQEFNPMGYQGPCLAL
ncbi:MAG TPA: alpha/beta fold hydrolase [Bacteriovoracaceae bacterium]|nr:alpha/beta fold hydrolase [Bacteriovoracaceae bacterium]